MFCYHGVGDGVLLRLRSHVEQDGFHLAEQIDENDGTQISAADLTWSVSISRWKNTVNYSLFS
jgi:GH15 family glucan-1,4-alpha-glucosidase